MTIALLIASASRWYGDALEGRELVGWTGMGLSVGG